MVIGLEMGFLVKRCKTLQNLAKLSKKLQKAVQSAAKRLKKLHKKVHIEVRSQE